MSKPTPAEIDAEIQALEELKGAIPEKNFFGDSNVAAIEADIDVLDGRLTDDDVYDKYGDNDYVMDSALGAASWLAGEYDSGDPNVTKPSENWSCLV